MKKNKIILYLLLILTLLFTACSSKTELTVVDSNIDTDKILFLRLEYQYFKESDSYYVVFTSLNNSGNINVMNLEISEDSDIMKNINDPIAMLMLMQSASEDEIYKINDIPLEKLTIIYEKTFDIENKLEFDYKVLSGDDYEPDYHNVLFGYSYINNEEYVPTKYFYSSTVAAQIKDKNGLIIANYLYSVFK